MPVLGIANVENELNELRDWREDRYVDCIFCLDYDNYQRMSIFGCAVKRTPTCRGNVCYMRQHKATSYFLYTSGCLNLTRDQYGSIQEETASAQTHVERGGTGVETQLCEVTATINTCLCANRAQCNSASSMEPFTEIKGHVLGNTNFDEVAHFKYFLPNDPVPSAMENRERDEYFLIKGVNASPTVSSAYSLITSLVIAYLFLVLHRCQR
ncbi:Protein F46C5.2 [Aphelenchoides avenae]|nr:Protein F46C5.2 [Aphelenchus avenae]